MLAKFEEENRDWGKVGYISAKQKKALNNLISDFEKNFKDTLSGKTSAQIQDKRVKKAEVLEIVQLVHADEF